MQGIAPLPLQPRPANCKQSPTRTLNTRARFELPSRPINVINQRLVTFESLARFFYFIESVSNPLASCQINGPQQHVEVKSRLVPSLEQARLVQAPSLELARFEMADALSALHVKDTIHIEPRWRSILQLWLVGSIQRPLEFSRSFQWHDTLENYQFQGEETCVETFSRVVQEWGNRRLLTMSVTEFAIFIICYIFI